MHADYDYNIKNIYFCKFPNKFVEKVDIMLFCKIESSTIKMIKCQWPSTGVIPGI